VVGAGVKITHPTRNSAVIIPRATLRLLIVLSIALLPYNRKSAGKMRAKRGLNVAAGNVLAFMLSAARPFMDHSPPLSD
jgi:hypothetical protein